MGSWRVEAAFAANNLSQIRCFQAFLLRFDGCFRYLQQLTSQLKIIQVE